jgi:hypothetical protein
MAMERTGIPIKKIVIIIAVENDHPQLFVRDIATYMSEAVAMFKGHTIPIL